MAGTVEYRATLTRIAAEITNNDLEGLKFLCKSIIPDGKLEQIVRPTALFQALEECDKLGIHNVSFLGKILKEVRRLDLSKKLVDELGESAAEGREESSYTATPELELEKANLLIADTVPVYQASVAENLKKAMAWNEEAKTRFIQKKYQLAADLYSMAIDNVPKMYTEELAKYYKNRAVCRLKMERYKEAIDDCDAALHLVPDDVKSMFRRAKCLFETNRHVDAHAQILQARKNDPKNKEVASLWSEIERKVKDLLVKCEEYVSDGNICFGFGQTEKALELYTKAVNHCPYTFPEKKASFIKCQANCHFEMKHHDSVLECCKEGLKLMRDPSLLLLKLKTEHALNHHEDALKTASLLESSQHYKEDVQSIVASLSKRAKRREKKKRQKEKLKKTKPEGDQEDEEEGDTAISQGQDSDLLNDEEQTSKLEINTIKSPTVSAVPQTDPRQLETERENKEATAAGILERKEHSGDDLPYSTKKGKSYAAIAMVGDKCKDAQKSHASHFPTLPNLETGGDEGLLPRRILLCCDKWQSWGESIPVINREMCRGLANNGHQVACLVLDASPIEIEEAANQDVRLIKCSEAPDIDNSNIQLMYRQLDFPFDPDLVIGHGKLTGPVALHFAKKFACCRLHILHDFPDETERFDDKAPSVQECDEVKLATEADFVAAVGVYLKDTWSTILNKEVIEIIPGLPNLGQRNSVPSLQCRCFVAAKFGSPLASGLDLAVWALNNSNKEEHLPLRATLIASNTERNSSAQAGVKTLKEGYDKDGIDLKIKTSVESREAYIDLKGSTVFLYPARIDPFGVAALDAIATGIPVLISSKSGLAHVLKRHFDVKFHDCILEAHGLSKRELEEDVTEWSRRVNVIFGDRDRAFECATTLRSEWISKFTWDKTMGNLMRDIAITGNLPLPSPSKLAIHFAASTSELELVDEIGLFDKRQKFILFLSPEDTRDMPYLVHLGLIRWACVFDFDQESVVNGYLAACDEYLKKTGKPACRLLPQDETRIHLPNGIPWILVNGTNAMPVDMGNHMKWIAVVLEQIKKMHVQPITFFILWKSNANTKSVCKKLVWILHTARATSLRDARVFVLSTTEYTDSRLDDIEEEWNTIIRHVNLQGLCAAIFNTAISNPLHVQDPDFSLPINGCEMKALPSELRWVDSELTVLYSSIGSTPEYGNDDANHFYRGGKISWYAIEMKQAVERESWEPLKNDIGERMNYAGASRVFFSHQRGTGGSTSARKILYDFHRQFPCVCLRTITPRTQDAIVQIWKFCNLPVIILADIKQSPGGECDIDVLYDALSSERVSCLIIQVVHRYTSRYDMSEDEDPTAMQEKKKYVLAETLTFKEADDFVRVYSCQNKRKASALRKHRNAEKLLQIPFYYALVAFEEDFTGLQPFVSECLSDLTIAQQSVLVFLAMAHYYAQEFLPAWQFAKILEVSARALYTLENHLPLKTLGLLIEEEGCWKPRHSLISKEILRQLLSKPYGLHEENWASKLSEKAIEFVQQMNEDVCSKILAMRDDDDPHRYYSSLVMDIPDKEDVIRVFKKAIKVFPDNPYFMVHLGRFISKEKGSHGFEEALKYTTKGILTAADYSPVVRSRFTQMKGIVYKRQVHHLINETGVTLEDIISVAQAGAKAFRLAVSISPELCEENYIPLVYMMYTLFRYVEKYNAQKGGFLGYIKESNATSQFLKDSLLETADALETVPESDHYPSLLLQLYSFQSGTKKTNDEILEVLRDLKESGKVSVASVNRGIVRIWYSSCMENGTPIFKVAPEMIQLLDESLRLYQQVGLTMRLWVKIAPHVPIELYVAEEKVAMWCSKDKSVWSYLYKYIFACIRILEGGKDRYEELRKSARDDLINELKNVRRFDFSRIRRPDRPVHFLGNGKGMAQLVTLDIDFVPVRKVRSITVKDTASLRRFHGSIIKTGKVGEILSSGLQVPFRPDLCEPPLVGDSFMYRKVHFYMAFTCYGVEAYNVRLTAEN